MIAEDDDFTKQDSKMIYKVTRLSPAGALRAGSMQGKGYTEEMVERDSAVLCEQVVLNSDENERLLSGEWLEERSFVRAKELEGENVYSRWERNDRRLFCFAWHGKQRGQEMTKLELDNLYRTTRKNNDRGKHLEGVEEHNRVGCRSDGNRQWYEDFFGWQGGRGLGSTSHTEVAHLHP